MNTDPYPTSSGFWGRTSPRYRIAFRRKSVYGPWWLFLPGALAPIGQFSSRERALFVMDAHAKGADCKPFLRGECRCRFECAR